MIALGSDMSGRAVLEKLNKQVLHGQTPIVMPCNRHNLSKFEDQTRKDAPPQQNGQQNRKSRYWEEDFFMVLNS